MNTEHTKKYFDKSGDEKIFTANLVENEKGFVSYTVENERLLIHNVFSKNGCGDYWNSFLDKVAKGNGCKRLRFSTRREPKAWRRAYPEYKVVGYILEKEI